MFRVVLAALFTTVVLHAADEAKAPVAANPIVELTGRIARVDAFRPGAGMPALSIDVNGTSTTVILGSMRYLMEQNINPTAGTEVRVMGYKLPNAVIAIEVRFAADGRIVRLRDENGWPVWRGGGFRHRGGNKN